MSWLRNVFSTKKAKIIQEENRNKAVLECLRAHRFGSPEIRKALIELNGIKVKQLSKIDGVHAITIYNTITGRRTNPKAMELIAASLALNVEDIFPERIPNGSRMAAVGGQSKQKEPQACTPEAPDRQP